MIAFVRTANINPGKTGSALVFAREVAAHLKQHHDVELEILLPVGGNPQRVAWSARYKDLATMEALRDKLNVDAAYWALLEKHAGDFQAASMHDAIWKTL